MDLGVSFLEQHDPEFGTTGLGKSGLVVCAGEEIIKQNVLLLAVLDHPDAKHSSIVALFADEELLDSFGSLSKNGKNGE